ncbi:54S ribosomal protein L25 [Colletotrichum spinosum]|uniref:54S ribosomal protein L25 n=1 Tax=Colletotrichum spinosum TaxID=1347390 RepID=A0A4R8PW44_9PEZI|nr:54S ribosomal protein L25 [Colletotrichum spinosum]
MPQHIQLAKALPKRLQDFFARWPPASILPAHLVGQKTGFQEITPNPFKPQKHHRTGKWHDPYFSLRRQAELVKLAREHGVEELLPQTRKATEYSIAKRVEHGLRVKGTGVGQKVKGKIHERMLAPRMEKRREAILAMPKLIKEWKKVGKKNWTRFPK